MRRMGYLFSVACCLSLVATPLFAQVPHLIRYQGQAVDSNGVPLEGPYTLIFRLYDAQTAGTVVWQETQANVSLSGGLFSLLLGQVTPLNVNWSQSLWLSIQVGTDPELAPRQQITSVPLAIVAERLDTPITTSTITDDANRLVPSGAIILWTGGSCPAGYTRVSELDGRFLVGGTSYSPAAGGSLTHTHGAGSYVGPSHTHTIPIDGYAFSGSANYGGGSSTWIDNRMAVGGAASEHNLGTAVDQPQSGASGTGPVTGTSAAADSRPPFATLLVCQKT